MSLLCKCWACWLVPCASWHSALTDPGTVHKLFFRGEGRRSAAPGPGAFLSETGTNLNLTRLEVWCRSWQRASDGLVNKKENVYLYVVWHQHSSCVSRDGELQSLSSRENMRKGPVCLTSGFWTYQEPSFGADPSFSKRAWQVKQRVFKEFCVSSLTPHLLYINSPPVLIPRCQILTYLSHPSVS